MRNESSASVGSQSASSFNFTGMNSFRLLHLPITRRSAPLGFYSLMTVLSAAAVGTNSVPAGGGFAAFHVISERNIFDHARHPHNPQQEPPVVERKNPDRFRLVGTMSSGRGVVAFCDSEQAEFKRAVHVGDTLGGLRVGKVAHDHICLLAGECKIQLPIQGQLQRGDDGAWRLLEPEQPPRLPEYATAATDFQAGMTKNPGPELPDVFSEKLTRKLESSGFSDKQLRKLEKEIEEMAKPTKEMKEYVRELKNFKSDKPEIKTPKKPDKALRRAP